MAAQDRVILIKRSEIENLPLRNLFLKENLIARISTCSEKKSLMLKWFSCQDQIRN